MKTYKVKANTREMKKKLGMRYKRTKVGDLVAHSNKLKILI